MIVTVFGEFMRIKFDKYLHFKMIYFGDNNAP